VPGGLDDVLTYGVPSEMASNCNIKRGSAVWVSVGRRRSLSLALVTKVHDVKPAFAVKPLQIHPSCYCFDESFVDLVEWCGRFYCSGSNRCLDLFWPVSLAKWLTGLVEAPKGNRKFKSKIPATLEAPPPLTVEQKNALEQLLPMLDGEGFRGALLHGVTGSGKTRVYLDLVEACLAKGRNVLILVPEIALTPQTQERFQCYLHTEVHTLHSNLSEVTRRNTWMSLLKGSARVLLGTRSALLAPGLEPGLIIIDEEHDSSYKQHDPSPRYHCREVAFHLAHRRGALVLLGSATPSLESWEYAKRGNLRLVQLKERARPVPMPKVEIIDLRKEAKQDSNLMLSPKLREALCDVIAQGHQAIVLHNRRGFSTSRVCTQCGDILECTDCKIPVVYHKQHNGLLCHYCGKLYPVKMPCPKCHASQFLFEGGGIEKLEQELQEWIPGARIVRMDRDTVQGVGSAEKILTAFRAGEHNILLGTQMVAKGHDFPNVQLVGVVAADTGSSLPDFRTSERMFQLLTQVAGRAGRKQEGGRVILQTWNPTDQVFRFALKHDYERFAEWELAQRAELKYPPYSRMLSVEVEGSTLEDVDATCAQIIQTLQANSAISMQGPVDAFVARIRKLHRKQFLIKAATPTVLRKACNEILALKSRANIKADIDPIALL